MGNLINDSIEEIVSGRQIDWRLNAWLSPAAALLAITGKDRIYGQKIPCAIPGGKYIDYHFEGGLDDIHFVPYDYQLNQPDGIIVAGYTLDAAKTFITLDGTKWRYNSVEYTLPNVIRYPIPAADAGGLIRIDRVKLTIPNQSEYMTGTPGVSATAEPLIEAETLLVDITVSLSGIEVTTGPTPNDGETLFGTVNPVATLGKTGDAYIQQTSGGIYKKELVAGVSTWVLKYTLPVDTNLVHKSGNETIANVKTFTSSPTIPDGVALQDAASINNIIQLPNDIRFQRIQRVIPRIRVTTSAPGKCREFLRMVPANNYAYVRVFVVNQNSTVKDYEFLTGYDALSESTWSQLTALNVYSDRGEDFSIEIKKVSGFGPTNFGIIFRYRNTSASGGSDASIKLDFALELPAVGVNYDQFAVLSTAEYNFSGSTVLYGRKLTLTADGKNWLDTDGKLFLKEGDGGGSASRFAVEDAAATTDRDFDLAGNNLEIVNGRLIRLKSSSASGLADFTVASSDSGVLASFTVQDASLNTLVFNFKPTGVELQTGAGTFFLPLTVNGVAADLDGNIEIEAGGAPTRFGIEDNTGEQDRSINMSGYGLDIIDALWIDLFVRSDSHNIDTYYGMNSGSMLFLQQVTDQTGTLVRTSLIQRSNSFSIEFIESGLTKTLSFPKAEATVAISVNGQVADAAGNITIEAGGGGLTDVTYSALMTLIGASGLTPGAGYRITDYQTVHTILYTADTNTGPTEVLVVRALTASELEPVAYSETFPDDLIYYSPTNDTTQMPGCTKGFIYRRIDTVWNNDFPNDFRNVRYRRFGSTVSAYSSGTTYALGNKVKDGSGRVFISLRNGNTGVAITNQNWWFDTGYDESEHVLAVPIDYSGNPVTEVDTANFADFPMFDTFGYAAGRYYSNRNEFTYSTQRFAGGATQPNNLLDACNNVFKSNCVMKNNVIGPDCRMTENTFSNGTWLNDNHLMGKSSMNGNILNDSDLHKLAMTAESSVSYNTGTGYIFETVLSASSISYNLMYFGDIDLLQLSSGYVNGNMMYGSVYNCSLSQSYFSGHVDLSMSNTFMWNSSVSDSVDVSHSKIVKNLHIRNSSFTPTNSMTLIYDYESSQYTKDVFRRKDGTVRISYMNDSDTLTVAAITA